MHSFEEIKAILREKSGKKLVVLSVIAFLLIAVIVFFAVFRFCGIFQLRQMGDYLGEIPNILESRRNELLMRGRIYEEDVLARSELGLILYSEEDAPTDAETLGRVRDAISADSVSLLDGQRAVLATTGAACPEENFSVCVPNLEPGQLHMELYPARSEDGEALEEKDGKGFVLISVPGSAKRSLVFEFACDTMLELYNSADDWAGVLERMLSGEQASAYAETGDKLTGYPLDDYSGDELTRLFEDLEEVFRESDKFWVRNNGKPNKLVTLLGKRYLAALMNISDEDTEVMMTVPLRKVIMNGVYIAAAVAVIIGFGIVLLQIYIFRRLLQNKAGEDAEPVSRKSVCRVTWPGLVVVLIVTSLFSNMLLLLENRSNAAFIALSKRTNVQYEIDFRKSQEGVVRSAFSEIYRDRARMLADFVAAHPDYQTREGLEKLNRVARTDYLMRFDSAGQELVSSNSYTGFSVDTNLDEAYRAVLLGYPDVVAGPAADPYTGRMQLGAAILMTDAEGQPDGFFLAVYSAADLNAELKRMSYENTINSFAVQEGHIAAAINNADGCFIAHTDPAMIGQRVEDYMEGVELGSSFEGFTIYNGKPMFVSAMAADDRTLMFMVPERGDAFTKTDSALMTLALLLILTLLYYPNAGVLVARAMAEAKGEEPPRDSWRSPMAAFYNGYSVFLTAFAIFALLAYYNGWWTSFEYVFSNNWSRGVHLFSIWAAIFIVSVTLCVKFVIRLILNRLEGRLSLKAKTVSRLVNSLVAYVANFFMIFSILSMFGVNTKALLASAGVISIAVGMGSQSMAADLLAGFFMMLEGSIHVGDRVTVGGVTGCVTDMGIRTTEITDDKGTVVILNNSKVSPVHNMSRKQAQPELKDAPEDKS